MCVSVFGFPVSSVVKNPPANQEMWVCSLGQEDLLEKETATHSNILAWEIPQTEEFGGLQFKGSQRARSNWATKHHHHISLCRFPGTCRPRDALKHCLRGVAMARGQEEYCNTEGDRLYPFASSCCWRKTIQLPIFLRVSLQGILKEYVL